MQIFKKVLSYRFIKWFFLEFFEIFIYVSFFLTTAPLWSKCLAILYLIGEAAYEIYQKKQKELFYMKKNIFYYFNICLFILEHCYILASIIYYGAPFWALVGFFLYLLFDFVNLTLGLYLFYLLKWRTDEEFYQNAVPILGFVHKHMPPKVKHFLINKVAPLYDKYLLKPYRTYLEPTLIRISNRLEDYFNRPADAFFVIGWYNFFICLSFVVLYFMTSGYIPLFKFTIRSFFIYMFGQMLLLYLLRKKTRS